MNTRLFRSTLFVTLMFFVLSLTAYAAGGADLQVRSTKSGTTVTIEKVLEEGKVLVSATDASNKAVQGLGISDFSVTQAGKNYRVDSVQPMTETVEFTRHIVLVLDNSYSMEERNAIKPLLAGVSELLKTVRPIDDVQIVVFDDSNTQKMGGRDLHVQTFKSNQVAELQSFLDKSYSKKVVTRKTVLHEAMLAGLDLISRMPATDPRFMVVFSDGEDLNSSFKEADVISEAKKLDRFTAFAIDYMPVPTKDKFLVQFASQNRGQVWKATAESNIVPIFQSVASEMLYYYVVSYLFPPGGELTVSPDSLGVDVIRITDAAPDTRTDTTALTVKPRVDSRYGIAQWKVSVSNKGGTVAGLEGEGTPAPELKIQLPQNVSSLAAGGDLGVKMELQDRKGQNVVIDASPVKVNVFETRASLAVSPATLGIDVIRAMKAAPDTRTDATALTVKPLVNSPHGIARWKVSVSNKGGSLADAEGEGSPAAELKVPLPANLLSLAAGGDLGVKMELQDRKGQNLVIDAPPVKVNVFETRASLAVEPTSLTVEEMKTIDASPMLGHVYFVSGSSEIQSQYVRLASPAETVGFDEQKFGGTLEKYYQLLNIVGKRLTDNPEAKIVLVGCNDNTGKEKGNKKLSGQRAEAVKNYLQTIWNIASERITVEVRNLPAKPSAGKLKEGQEENRRVEIQSDDPKILAPIRSVYFTNRLDVPALKVNSAVASQRGIKTWKLSAANVSGNYASLTGEGLPAAEINVPMDKADLKSLIAGDVTVRMELLDRAGQNIVLSSDPVKVNFVQTSQRLAQKQDQRVQEKYALILFDFDKDTIEARNQEIVNRIAARIRELPQSTVAIVGYTDNIGKESYNIKLSERRALAVYKMLSAAYGEAAGERIKHSGVGPRDPLYDNLSPEARSFNRTVTITLEYMSAE